MEVKVKSEKEKMPAGDLFDASDPLLTQERQRARTLTHQLNVTRYGDPSAYQEIRAALLPNASADIWIEPPFFCDSGYNNYTGERVFFNFNCVLMDVMPIRVGSHVMLGPNYPSTIQEFLRVAREVLVVGAASAFDGFLFWLVWWFLSRRRLPAKYPEGVSR